MLNKLADTVQQRVIRSFVRRGGRITIKQAKSLAEELPIYGCALTDGSIDPIKIFGRTAPLIVEIGFGMGQSLLEIALAHPEHNYIGIEVHRPGVGSLLAGLATKQLQNVRVFNEDAVQVLNQCITDESLAAVYIFFPDPWQKKRHHKRRLIQAELVGLVKTKLLAGGILHLATDWEEYANHMLHILSNARGWENQAGAGQFHPRPSYRPLTKFEQRGQRLGHGVWDLLFRKI